MPRRASAHPAPAHPLDSASARSVWQVCSANAPPSVWPCAGTFRCGFHSDSLRSIPPLHFLAPQGQTEVSERFNRPTTRGESSPSRRDQRALSFVPGLPVAPLYPPRPRPFHSAKRAFVTVFEIRASAPRFRWELGSGVPLLSSASLGAPLRNRSTFRHQPSNRSAKAHEDMAQCLGPAGQRQRFGS